MTAMYQSHFGLAEAPFTIAPNPRYLYMSQRHQEALAHLLYGLGGDGGFVLLTGEVGAGKTTICRCLLEQIPESCDVAYIFNPKLTAAELLSTICVEFHIDYPPGNTSIKVFIDCINAYLLDAHARGRSTVLIIDEAQNLSADVLEQMRLLTNLETNQRKLLQIILLGQPELAAMLDRPELRQLAQRIVARYHLGPLTRAEVAAYVGHRLEVSGAKRQLFPASLMGTLYRLSGGVPRIINVLCDRALLGSYVQGKEQVSRATLTQAANEVLYRPARHSPSLLRPLLFVLILVTGGGVATAVQQYQERNSPAPAAPPLRVAAAPVALSAPAPQAAPKPAVALAETLDWPAEQPRAQSRAMAYAALFRAWGARDQEQNSCRQAEGLGLRCQTARGGLDEIRQLNRPAVLRLRDDRGLEFYATLTALDDRSASFALGTETVTVALSALAAQWSGYYTLLWRAPPALNDKLRSGERGPTVDWLAMQLARAQDRTAEVPADAVFDETLVRRLKQFQLAQGLVPDSKLGPQTVMRLSGAGDEAAPKLAREAEGIRHVVHP
ncbi:MAG: AAA family ATPase [Rhodocyclales bacterium]|nr:AAA family ATPase [Rhodocyclales bacterium]